VRHVRNVGVDSTLPCRLDCESVFEVADLFDVLRLLVLEVVDVPLLVAALLVEGRRSHL